MKFVLFTATVLVLTSPAMAQMDMAMPGMKMPASVKPKLMGKPKPKIVKEASGKLVSKRVIATTQKKASIHTAFPNPDAGPGMPDMRGMPMIAPEVSSPTAPKPTQDISSMPGMDMNKRATTTAAPSGGSAMSGMSNAPPQDAEIGNAPAPPPPTDHAADTVFGLAQMAGPRTMLRHEIGGVPAYSVLFNLAEYRAQKGGNGYRWDGEGWFGGDLNRFAVKTEGEGTIGRGLESGEVQALYSRAITPYFNVEAGIRQDIRPQPTRTYATVGFQGLAPYWFEVSGAIFLSDKGDLLGRLEGYYDQRITQKLILQPRIELNFAAQDVPVDRTGAGLSTAELGLRLRYEIKRELAPYIGISWDGKVGGTADYARAAGERVQGASLVVGMRTWF